MIVQLFKDTDRRAGETAAATPSIQPKGTREVAAAPVAQDVLDRCNAMRGGVRAMLRLAGEGAFDLWQGESRSAYLEQFETKLREQRRAMESIHIAESGADYSFLVRKAQAALDAFGETVRREIIEGVDAGMEELAFYAALRRVKDSAVKAAGSVGSIQLAAA